MPLPDKEWDALMERTKEEFRHRFVTSAAPLPSGAERRADHYLLRAEAIALRAEVERLNGVEDYLGYELKQLSDGHKLKTQRDKLAEALRERLLCTTCMSASDKVCPQCDWFKARAALAALDEK